MRTNRSALLFGLACLGAIVCATPSRALAQGANSYCLTGGGGELGRCGFPTFEECRAYSSGFGVCVASERPSWASTGAAAAPAPAKRRR